VTDTLSELSPGWQHSYATRLILPDMTGGEPSRAVIVSPGGNRLRFQILGKNSFYPYPGVNSSLSLANGVYIQTLRSQEQYRFDSTGRLIEVRDAQGRAVQLTYTGTPAQLTLIRDAQDVTRALTLTYENGHVKTVSDGTRIVTYDYDANGRLSGATDVMGRRTQYDYTNTTFPYYLTQITAGKTTSTPQGTVVEQTQYDANGRVFHQTLQDGQQLDFVYNANATTVTRTGTDGRQEVSRYDYATTNTITSVSVANKTIVSSTYDDTLAPGTVIDGNGQATQTVYSGFGLPTSTTNALNQTTRIEYDGNNHPIRAVDPLGVETRWRYNTQGLVISATVGLTTSLPLGLTTLYTYTTNTRGTILTDQRSPDGIVTHHTYNATNQAISTTIGANTAIPQTTGYAYDAVGRVVTTTVGLNTPLARQDVTVYNADNSISQTIQNYQNRSFDPTYPDQDVITTYGYDALGRQIWVRDPLGQYDVTRYNSQGQMVASARNLSGPLSFDSQGQPLIPVFSAAQPDRNVATFYGYDGLGRTTLVTETGILTGTFDLTTLTFSNATTRVTRTEYDELSRPITTILNYRPGVPTTADTNLQILTQYDNAGNVVGQRDAYGRWTYITYDVLNRPIRTIQNYEDGNPLTGARDTDLITETRYDAVGRIERQIINVVAGVFTATEPITDRVTLLQYDGLGRTITTTLNLDPPTLGTRNDTNRVQLNAYDPISGRMLGQRDSLGRWVSQQYDVLGRVQATIQNCRDIAGNPIATTCAAFVTANPDRNLRTQTGFDALGRVDATTDPLSVVSRFQFDGLGRTITTIQNYVSGGAVDAETNVTTSTTYDVLARAVTVTDAAGKISRMQYNGLGATTVMTDTLGRVTRQGYDGQGTLRWSRIPDGRVTIMQVDGLGRVVTTIQNYQDGVVAGNEPVDQDLTTRTVYDLAGRRAQVIDEAGRVTQFAYDNFDHLIAVMENARSDCSPSLPANQRPCNVTTSYTYDRAGNRTAIVDANGHTRRFTYDAANQLITAVDARNQTTSYQYDAGGRMISTSDPRGADSNLTYGYDEVDRPTTISATNLGTITQYYNARGQRTNLIDSTGTTSFGYDPLGRVTQVTAPNTGSVGYRYDARGLRTRLTYPGSTTVIYLPR